MIYQAMTFLLLFMVISHGSMEEQYNLTGSLPAAILGKEFSWECSTPIPPDQTINAVIFYRNDTRVGYVGRFPNGTCAADSLNPRYDYRCVTDHDFSLIIPGDNMTVYENNSVWQCQHYGIGHYRSSNHILKIAVFIRNISLSPPDDPLTLTEGTSKKVTCSVNIDAYPIPVIRWYIGDTEIGSTKETLELTADIIHDGKILRCLASNNDKFLNKTTFLNILYKPVVAVDPSSSLDVSIGDQMTVRCSVLKSNPGVILGYEWSVLGDNDVIGRESHFTINTVSINDNKTLQCRATNSMGISEPADVRINVLLTPTRPRFIKALCCEEHADVVWVTSTPDMIEQMSFVQFSSSSTGKEFSNASSVVNSTLNDIYSVRVTTVFPDATYTFRVVTVNQYGHVTSSDASCHVKKKINEGNVNSSQPRYSAEGLTYSFSTSSVAVTAALSGLVMLTTVIAVMMYLRARKLNEKENITTKSSSSLEKTNYEVQMSSIQEDPPYQEIINS